MIVYFEICGLNGSSRCIIHSRRLPSGTNPCYFCPCQSCTEYYSDGLRRVRGDEKGYEFLRRNKRVKIVKIINQ